MIELPKRSVTRFFIPLIDVLILLFAIFIMLPVVDERKTDKSQAETLSPEDIKRLKGTLDQYRATVRKLQNQKMTPEEATQKIKELQTLLDKLPELVEPVILEIDAETGELTAAIEGEDARLKIQSKDDARNFIAQKERWLAELEKRVPIKGVRRKLLFIFQYPPSKLNSPHPTVG